PGAVGALPRGRRCPGSALGRDAADPGDGFGRDGNECRAAECMAARLGPVPHVAEPDQLCPHQRHGRRPAAAQRGANYAAAGRLTRDPSLNLPPPPVLPELPQPKPVAVNPFNAYQVQVSGNNVNFYNFAMAHLRTLPGVESATPQQINPGGTSYVLVQYKG